MGGIGAHLGHSDPPIHRDLVPSATTPERVYTALRSGCLLRHRFCGLSDHVEHKVGLGKHRNVAAVGLEGLRSHTLCDETLQGGLDGTVTAGNDVPARFRSPSCTVDLLIEQVRRGRGMRGPNELLLLFW